MPGPHRSQGGHGLAHPEYPFLHRGLHHGPLQLLLRGQVSRDGAADLRGRLLLDGPQSSLRTEKGLSDSSRPRGQKRLLSTSESTLVSNSATRAFRRPSSSPTTSFSFSVPGLRLWPRVQSNPHGSREASSLGVTGDFAAAQASGLGHPFTQYHLLNKGPLLTARDLSTIF